MVQIKEQRTTRGHRTGIVTAELGQFSAEGQGKTAAVAALHEQIAAYSVRRAYIATVDGTILAVYQTPGGVWGYDHARDMGERTYPCSTWGAKTYEQAVQQATDHANQCYGGVAWINRG